MTGRKVQGKRKSGGGALAAADMGKAVGAKSYFRKLEKLQDKLREIQQAYIFSTEAAAIVFEGWDTAGKGGTIRRITTAMDARSVKVWPTASPREYYKERHYLARFWEQLPPNGAISIFDRSWYGRVLVERVEGFATRDEWSRAYREINEFEKMLTDDGTRVVKFFLHITPDEQLRRFEQRLTDPLRRWKLQYEDFRNREKWDEYETAIEDMLEKTSTKYAPWYVIPANDKKYARLEVISRICDRLSAGVDLSPRSLDEQTLTAARKYFDFDL